MMEKKEENRWVEVNTKGPGYPRFCLRTEEKNFLLSWAAVSQIEASEDFLSIRFLCENGMVQLSSTEPMRDLFWSMQMERVWMIDGRMLACRITPMEEFQ